MHFPVQTLNANYYLLWFFFLYPISMHRRSGSESLRIKSTNWLSPLHKWNGFETLWSPFHLLIQPINKFHLFSCIGARCLERGNAVLFRLMWPSYVKRPPLNEALDATLLYIIILEYDTVREAWRERWTVCEKTASDIDWSHLDGGVWNII